MAWTMPRFGTIAAAIAGGAGSISGGDYGVPASQDGPTTIAAGSNFNNLRNGRISTDTTFEAGGGSWDWVAVDLDRGAVTNPVVDVLVVVGPRSTTPAPSAYGIYAYVFTTDALDYSTTGGYTLFFAGSGTTSINFGATSRRYLRFLALSVAGNIETMTARQFVYTNYIGAGTTKRGPEPGWRDEFLHSVSVAERTSGWTSSHDFGARRSWTLTYRRVSDATDRAVLEGVTSTAPDQPFVFWPSFTGEGPRVVRLVDFDVQHEHPTPARLSSPEPTYRIQLEEVLA